MKSLRYVFVAVCVVLTLNCGRAETKPTSSLVAQESRLEVFPPLGPAKPVEDGVVVHKVALNGSRIWIYLPEKLPANPMPCVFIAPAGVPPFVGNGYGTDLDQQKNPEHLPYVHAGFAVVAYDTDGELANPDDVTYEQVQTAASAFMNAEAGVRNARNAIDYVLKMVPAVDPKRLYTAGHSSAGRISLLVAESEPRIAACLAYAPVTDVERRVEQIASDAGQYLDANLPGFRDFLQKTSPLRQVERLRCPTFLYHSEEDERIAIADSETFVEALKKTNPRVTFVRGKRGDHYESMIREGVPKGIDWLQGLAAP